MTPSRKLRIGLPEAVLILTTIIWGPTYLIVQRALALSEPMFLVGARFALAAFTIIFLFGRLLPGLTWREARAGTLIGLSIGLSYVLQALGLLSIPSSESAIISTLYVPLVPLLQWIFLRRPPSLLSGIGTGLAMVGLLLIAGPHSGSFGLGVGEILTVLCAVATAGEVILISAFSNEGDVRRITIVQLIMASLLAFAAMGGMGERVPDFSWGLAGAVLFLGLSSAGIQLAMNWAQKTVSPTRATLIYTAEPVWAAIVGRIAGERLPASTFAGAALIIGGIITSEFRVRGTSHPGKR